MDALTGSSSNQREVNEIIKNLEKGVLDIRDISEKYALNASILRAERKLGIRKTGKRGFDVINQLFFVEEEWLCRGYFEEPIIVRKTQTFDSFSEFYIFLDGEISENACYYQYTFEDDFLKDLHIDIAKLTAAKSFTKETIDDYTYEKMLQEEVAEFNHFKRTNKKSVKQWLNKFTDCETYDQFQRVCCKYRNSKLNDYLSVDFFIFQYAFNSALNKKSLETIIQYILNGESTKDKLALELCLIYPPECVLDAYDTWAISASAERQQKRRMRRSLEEFIAKLNSQSEVLKEVRCRFDREVQVYYEKTSVFCYTNRQGQSTLDRWNGVSICRAFESFDEFIEYRAGDLRNCDLSEALELDADFSKYRTDETTKLPHKKSKSIDYRVQKLYTDGKYYVRQSWYDKAGACIRQQLHKFSYFFDFVAFMRGDLSDADLIMCAGLKNLPNADGINFSGARMTSDLCDRFCIPYQTVCYDERLRLTFPTIEENEAETALVLQAAREDECCFNCGKKIGYVSDLHLLHRITNAGCRSTEDVIYVLKGIADEMVKKSSLLTLIGGDVSSEYSLFVLFVKLLAQTNRRYGTRREFVFVLGNHELWSFPNLSLEQIVEKYRTLLKENGMHLLHNELLYKNAVYETKIISYTELTEAKPETISEQLEKSRLVIFGGLGFSAYNLSFNANYGIYRETIDRKTELLEGKKIETLYEKLTEILSRKNTIVFTHMPKREWCADESYHNGFVYVSGHTHRNEFYDDGVTRVYSDNQVGYRSINPHLKEFLMDDRYDCFTDYEDGVYEITAQEYEDFARGKNILMTFNRQVNVLHMLKRNGYYCFIHENKSGGLSILNGGSLKRLETTDVQYYYENMDNVIASINAPLAKYSAYQKKIAREIKKIGGSGRIHGCIVDIDFYNHVYVNPFDGTTTGYWAENIINKLVYPDVPTLLEAECPRLYLNYSKLLESGKSSFSAIHKGSESVSVLPQRYLETDIYKASREIKKMQKLTANILTTWCELPPERNELPCKIRGSGILPSLPSE